MGITVFIEKENRTATVKAEKGMTVAALLERLNINPVTVIVSRGDELAIDDDEIQDGDSVRILSVISGG